MYMYIAFTRTPPPPSTPRTDHAGDHRHGWCTLLYLHASTSTKCGGYQAWHGNTAYSQVEPTILPGYNDNSRPELSPSLLR